MESRLAGRHVIKGEGLGHMLGAYSNSATVGTVVTFL